MNKSLDKAAEVQFAIEGDRTVVQVSVPKGTRLTDLSRLQQALSTELIPRIAPRGCEACLSGADYIIRERLENVIHVDLETGRLHEIGDLRGIGEIKKG